jgi:WD40 repeat protein
MFSVLLWNRSLCGSVGVSCVSISGGLADMSAVGLMNGSVVVYLLAEMRQILSLTGHALCVNDATWSSTGTELVSCADDGVMQLWCSTPALILLCRFGIVICSKSRS